MEVLKTVSNNNGFSVQIQDGEIKVWLDVWFNSDNELEADWNMYIFHHWNAIEMQIKAYQENCDNFIECSELAIESVEIYLQKNTIEFENEFYLLGTDKINVGDWFYCTDKTNYKHIFQCIGLTDETHLQVKNGDEFGQYKCAFDIEYPYGDWDSCYSQKIVASTKDIPNLDKFSPK